LFKRFQQPLPVKIHFIQKTGFDVLKSAHNLFGIAIVAEKFMVRTTIDWEMNRMGIPEPKVPLRRLGHSGLRLPDGFMPQRGAR
jgi:hypothetical protein